MIKEISIITTEIKELKKLFSGKVRDIYEISNDKWLIVTTDRISAFDVVFREGIPGKGIILNRISNFWFSRINFIENHIISTTPEKELPFLTGYEGIPERSVIVRKVNRLPIECVVRGYLFGSVYDEYRIKGTAGGIKLPLGLSLAEILPQPIFTPSTKAETGHDENIGNEEFIKTAGKKYGSRIKQFALEIYKTACKLMEEKGIILSDTKFEFGIDNNNKLILVDEVLTPDSSRYWVKEGYKTGESPKSYDKQFLRDYLNTVIWDKKPPAPVLPDEIIEKTKEKYRQILEIITSL